MSRAAGLDPIRLRAAELLLRWRRAGATIEELLEQAEAADRAAGREFEPDARRRLRELLFGIMHLLGRYEFAISLRSRRSKKIDDPAWAALLVGMHELFAMRTPDHAAVEQAVQLCKRLGGAHASGFVNGVLRSAQRDGLEHGFPSRQQDALAHASSWLSHPRWIVERWQAQLGDEEMFQLCEFDNRRRPLVVRCRPGRRPIIEREFVARDWSFERSPLAPDALRLAAGVSAGELIDAFADELIVQDEAAQLIAPLVASEEPKLVVDLCAAPGSKALHLRDLLPGAQILACDRSPRRMRRLRENSRRMAANLHSLAQDGRVPALREGQADAVLLDAPCSGSGVFARRHDARWRRSVEQLRELSELQYSLARAAARLLRPGGVMVYATCALEPEENDELVDRLLASGSGLEEIGVDGLVPASTLRAGRLALWPQRHDSDGAFAVRLRRRAS